MMTAGMMSKAGPFGFVPKEKHPESDKPGVTMICRGFPGRTFA